jgi:hypothetical protein
MLFFFHVRDCQGVIRDEEGSELRDLAAARLEAFLSAQDFAIEDIKRGGPVMLRQIEITDGDDNVLGTMPVIDIVH